MSQYVGWICRINPTPTHIDIVVLAQGTAVEMRYASQFIVMDLAITLAGIRRIISVTPERLEIWLGELALEGTISLFNSRTT